MKCSKETFEKLLATDDKELISHAICDYADEVFYSNGARAVVEPFRTVITVEMFFGEIMNGGLYQYFTNGHEAFAAFAPEALDGVGLQLCAEVMRSALRLFPAGILEEDAPDYMAAIDGITELPGEDPFEEVEAPFWAWFYAGNQDAIRNRLHGWILEHRRDFV